MNESQNDIAWNKLFDKFKILKCIENEDLFIIKSSQINELRQARLMTKFDFKSQLPKIFAENHLSILPISRGSYIISKIKTFEDFEDNKVEIERIGFSNYIESIDYQNITSETIALNCAYFSEIISDFTNEKGLMPTVSGRMSSSVFNFKIDTLKNPLTVKVENAQIEIDGGYEGFESLNLIEVKNSISKNFIIRQLFYPYKLWENKVHKKVRPIFLTYTNGIFHFREYEFRDPNHYNSIKLLKEKKYIIREGGINNELIQKILYKTNIATEPQIPFPQANSFERIINLSELLYKDDHLSQEDITNKYDFDRRQTNYYTDAGRYLGLIEKKKEEYEIVYSLTNDGKHLFELSIFDRQVRFIELILSHLAFNKTLKLYFKKFSAPNKSEIVQIMQKSNLYNINSDQTFERRSSTILSWINWILDQIEE